MSKNGRLNNYYDEDGSNRKRFVAAELSWRILVKRFVKVTVKQYLDFELVDFLELVQQ